MRAPPVARVAVEAVALPVELLRRARTVALGPPGLPTTPLTPVTPLKLSLKPPVLLPARDAPVPPPRAASPLCRVAVQAPLPAPLRLFVPTHVAPLPPLLALARHPALLEQILDVGAELTVPAHL